jgi:hypothetical protein
MQNNVPDMAGTSDDRLNNLTRFILESVDKNASTEVKESCMDDTNCRLKRVFEYLDDNSSVRR